MNIKARLSSLLESLLPICLSWIQEKDGKLLYIDPVDNEEISAHYGATHMAATLVIYGHMTGQKDLFQIGIRLLDSILKRWDLSKDLPSFHFDFNNFALCVISDIIKPQEPVLYKRIQNTILNTADSKHDTTNWLPMRWYVNKKRYEWTNDEKYLKVCDYCKTRIELSTNKDGGIEDRLPKGTSFNLQYDVATVGVLQFLRQRGVEYDLTREYNFLKNTVAPDGDINYQGRGTNQIFGWSLWVYLLASAGKDDELGGALDYLNGRVIPMFEKHNLMLNSYDGKEKYLWWDYHYCSVYTAHFLFWLVLSILDFRKKPIEEDNAAIPVSSGFHIYRDKDCFVSTFDGRKEYLAEKGPSVCAIWIKKYGMISKGSFGPWLGSFGNKYSNESVLRNYCGLVKIHSRINVNSNNFLSKVIHRLGLPNKQYVEFHFCPIVVQNSNGGVKLDFYSNGKELAFLNIPIFKSEGDSPRIELTVDKDKVDVSFVGEIRNQYGAIRLFQSKLVQGRVWSLYIK